MQAQTILDIRNVSKSFGAVKALRGVNFNLSKGEIHAIAGENGAGKSTLMNIIDGILQPDEGQVRLDGSEVIIASPAHAQQLGIGFVHQEIALCPDVSVAENVYMSAINTSPSWTIDTAKLKRQAEKVFSELGGIDPSVLVKTLSISQQQLVEIAKALTLDCRILILDEPTAALTEAEAQKLFTIMHRLTEQGISIIYISHRMAEIFDHCDRVSVFKDGQYVNTWNVGDTTPEQIVNAMVGRVLDKLYPQKLSPEDKTGDIILEVEYLSCPQKFTDISFQLKRGEILGLGGLIGAGRSELVKAICRLEGEVSGQIRLNGQQLNLKNYRDSVDHGIVYLSEDRKGDGIFLNLSIAENISALKLDQVGNSIGLLNRGKEHAQARDLGKMLNLKFGNLSDPVSSLSGGNQQKVALAKLLSVGPKLIFLDEPTRGVDVGAKVEIHRILRELSSDGVGILMISSELPELIGVCDRVMVMCEGRLSGEVSGDDMTEENIMHLASKIKNPSQAA